MTSLLLSYSKIGIMESLTIIFFLGMLLISLPMFIGYWKILTKAGKPGWAFLVPIYNIIVLLDIVKKPTWWLLLLLIPLVNIVFFVIIYHRLSLAFGKDAAFTVGIFFLPMIFLPILGFGNSVYNPNFDTYQQQ